MFGGRIPEWALQRDPEARTENRSEAKRRAEDFVRIEASVGMD